MAKVTFAWDRPSLSLVVKLGSLVVHAQEFMEPGGHPFDKTTFETEIQDPEVKAWIDKATKMGFLPQKRM
jgi:hypothetical protein